MEGLFGFSAVFWSLLKAVFLLEPFFGTLLGRAGDGIATGLKIRGYDGMIELQTKTNHTTP